MCQLAKRLELEGGTILRRDASLEETAGKTRNGGVMASHPILGTMGNNQSNLSTCDGCGKSCVTERLKQCTNCQGVRYCSRDCQRNDWKNHKKMCARMRTARKQPDSASADDAAVAAYLRSSRLEERGDLAGSMVELQRAYSLAPTHPAILDKMATKLCDGGRVDEGIAIFERLIAIDPARDGVDITMGNCARAHMMKGNLPRAIELFDEARRLSPTNPMYPGLQGMAFMSSGRAQEAMDALDRAIELCGDDLATASISHNNAGLFRMQDGDYARAADHFRAVLRHNSNDMKARAMLARCEDNLLADLGFRRGERVEVHGLTGAPQHNGAIGRVKGLQGDRVTVTLPAATVALRPANLRKAPADTNN